jgi:cytochrome c
VSLPRAARVTRLAALAAVLLPIAGCHLLSSGEPTVVPGGDPKLGPQVMRQYGCQSCHTVPGVRGANAVVGPPLDGFGHRVYIAGELPNTPENLVRWVQHPRHVRPGTAMPDVGVTEEDARHIAAYLYTLR